MFDCFPIGAAVDDTNSLEDKDLWSVPAGLTHASHGLAGVIPSSAGEKCCVGDPQQRLDSLRRQGVTQRRGNQPLGRGAEAHLLPRKAPTASSSVEV